MMLCHYSFECKEGRNFPPLLRIGGNKHRIIEDSVAVSLQLFAGETKYKSKGRRKALKNLL